MAGVAEAEVLQASMGGTPSPLARERTVARPRCNRWLVPPAALAIHLGIGMAYGFLAFRS